MVTSTERNQGHVEFIGLSTDTKPVDYVGNGSAFLEMDTGDLYFFNGEDKTWVKF